MDEDNAEMSSQEEAPLAQFPFRALVKDALKARAFTMHGMGLVAQNVAFNITCGLAVGFSFPKLIRSLSASLRPTHVVCSGLAEEAQSLSPESLCGSHMVGDIGQGGLLSPEKAS